MVNFYKSVKYLMRIYNKTTVEEYSRMARIRSSYKSILCSCTYFTNSSVFKEKCKTYLIWNLTKVSEIYNKPVQKRFSLLSWLNNKKSLRIIMLYFCASKYYFGHHKWWKGSQVFYTNGYITTYENYTYYIYIYIISFVLKRRIS